MLIGDTIYLTPIDVENAETARTWVNDPEINRWMLSGHVPVSREQERAWYGHVDASDADHVFEIHTRDGDRYIGNCGLHKVNMLHRNGELGILVGELDAQGKGYGSDAIVTVLRYAFHALGLHTVQISYIDGNDRSAHLYSKLGFTVTGRYREHLYLRGEFCDLVLMDMTRSEYEARYGASD
ncbi:MAG: GNAT family protein [Coriobacteriia bacterium]|nr:GNAT family protein [Coriobacteriia bacterium]